MGKRTTGLRSLLKFFGKPPEKTITEIQITHEGAKFRVALKRVASARRYTLRVRSATRDIVLTMPARPVCARPRNSRKIMPNGSPSASRVCRSNSLFAPGAKIPLRGVLHVLRHCPEQPQEDEGRSGWSVRDGAETICAGGDPAHFERRIADFLRREARRDLETAVRRHAATIGRAPIALSLRDTSSRWGSCSAKGALNFSWRLILAPPFVLDYLAAHETAHLRHHDHSDKFWALTKSLCPENGSGGNLAEGAWRPIASLWTPSARRRPCGPQRRMKVR